MYPNQLYLVSYMPGCSGTFISNAIVQGMRHGKMPSYDFSDTLNAHFVPSLTSMRWRGKYNSRIRFIDQMMPPHNRRPIFFNEHPEPDWARLFDIFPNTKNILIQRDIRTLIRVQANFHFKIYLPEFKRNGAEDTDQYWRSMQQHNPNLQNYNIDNAPGDELLKGIECYTRVLLDTGDSFDRLCGKYNALCPIPDEYSDRVVAINYYDVIHNPELVLDTISKFIDYPITDAVVESYNSYLKQQTVLMPWLDDK
jgi:hypothetical protein